MPQYTIEEFATLLTRTYMTRFRGDHHPRTVTDVTDKGEEVLEFILPNPEDRRFSVSLQTGTYRGSASDCTLYFGQAEVTRRLAPEEAVSAMEEILADRIVAVVRYKNQNAYENRRKVNATPSEWLYQLPDDAEALERMLDKLRKPASLLEKLSGKYVGVFEVYRWSGSEVIERK